MYLKDLKPRHTSHNYFFDKLDRYMSAFKKLIIVDFSLLNIIN